MSNQIVVVGSCMIDFVSYAPRLPKQGETIHGSKFVTNFGGKGANQCVAAAKLGGQTQMIAKLGNDLWGDKYIANLQQMNIDTRHVLKTSAASSGIAQINVSSAGDNQIVIVPGANTLLSAQDVENARDAIQQAKVVVLQLETSAEVALAAIKMSKNVSILNGAPALSHYDEELIRTPSIFCVNESEASVFTGIDVTDVKSAEKAARNLIERGCKSVMLTLGAQGVVYLPSGGQLVHVPCPKVECVDSTGAGDAFLGALAFFLANYDLPMERHIRNACLVASDSVTRPGTQISYPTSEILLKCDL